MKKLDIIQHSNGNISFVGEGIKIINGDEGVKTGEFVIDDVKDIDKISTEKKGKNIDISFKGQKIRSIKDVV